MKKQSKRTGSLLQAAALLVLLSCIGYRQARAQTGTPISYSEKLTVSRLFDHYSELLYCANDSVTSHCEKTFVFNIYQDDTMTVDWDFNPAFTPNDIYDRLYRIYYQQIINNTVIWPYLPGYGIYSPGYAPYQQMRIPMSQFPLGHNSIRGEFLSSVGAWVDEIFIDFNVVKKVENAWVEAPAFCKNDFINAQQDYHFRIKTAPVPLDSIMFHAPLAATGPSGQSTNCTYREQMQMFMESQTFGPQVHGVSHVVGSTWYPATAQPMEDHYISYNDMLTYINGNNGGSMPLNIHFSDGVRDVVIPAPIIMNDGFPNGADPYSNTPSASYHYYDYTVQGNEVWDPQHNPAYGSGNLIRIEHRLRIPAGTTLSITNMNVEFGPEADVWIEPAPASQDPSMPPVFGGKLALNNTTLTAFLPCDGPMQFWKGIVALGNSSLDQKVHTVGPNPYLQALVTMNNSTISYAREAFRNGDPTDLYHQNGGIIMALDSRFYNNEHTANFQSYLSSYQLGGNTFYSPYRSHFYHCDFTSDQGIFTGFIFGREIRGLEIAGCSFTGPQSQQNTTLSKGIEGNDLGLIVHNYTYYNGFSAPVTVPCTFQNLNTAVTTSQVNPLFGALRVTNASFDNNMASVTGYNITAPMVQYNQFAVPAGPGSQDVTAGVRIYGGSGYHVSENQFNGPGTSGKSIGVLAWNTGSADNKIQRNNYTNLGTASLGNYANKSSNPSILTGLQILCNQNSGNGYDIAAMGGNTVTDGIAPNQGNLSLPAGNTFSHTSGGFDIYNPTGQVAAINYYYKSGGAQEQPFNVSVGNVSVIGIGQNDQCPEDIIPNGPVRDDPRFGPLSAVIRNVQFYQSDSVGDLDLGNLQATLSQWADPHADLTNADLMIETGRWEEANNLYNQIVGKYGLQGQEADEFNTFGRQLLDLRISQVQNGLQYTDLSDRDLALLQSIADNAKMWPKLRAQAWLQKYDGREISNTILYPGPAVTLYRTLQETADANSVYPNPVKDLLTVRYTASGTAAPVFELTTVDGKIVRSTVLASGSQQVSLQGLAAGIYLYHVLENGKIMMHGKITKD